MTRAHARLLGPCFKTGPESTQSYCVADWRFIYFRSPFENTVASSRSGPGSAPGVRPPGWPPALATGRTRTVRDSAPHNYTVERVGREKHRGYERTTCVAVRPPPRALDRHPTGRDVLQGDKCTLSSSHGTRPERDVARTTSVTRSRLGDVPEKR